MADITITIQASSVQYTTWLRTSYISLSQISESGMPKIELIELGPDQLDAFINFWNESIKEVSKLFSSRQGDAEGAPFEYSDSTATYRFKATEPTLNQQSTLEIQLTEDVKDAIYSYLSILWFNTKGMESAKVFFSSKYDKLAQNIERNLYLLHD